MPSLFDPGGASTPGLLGVSVLPSALPMASASTTLLISGLNHDSLHPRCLRFAAWVTPQPRKTRFRAAASLTRAGSTCGTPLEVSDSPFHPPPPGLAWRTGDRALTRPCYLEHRPHRPPGGLVGPLVWVRSPGGLRTAVARAARGITAMLLCGALPPSADGDRWSAGAPLAGRGALRCRCPR